jgi:hypothetical protein
MLQKRIFRSKFFIFGIVASLALLVFPHEALGQAGPGSLAGFIYWENQKSPVIGAATATGFFAPPAGISVAVAPVEGAIVKLRNVLTGVIYQSEPTDKIGSYIIKNIPEGRYIIGVGTPKGNFNFDRELQIKAQELAKLNLVLKVDKNGVLIPIPGALGGAATAVGFFATPIGIAVAVVAAGAVGYGLSAALGQAEKSPARR